MTWHIGDEEERILAGARAIRHAALCVCAAIAAVVATVHAGVVDIAAVLVAGLARCGW